ncbi:Exodeoxyribonuclease VII small subunit [Granulicella pectinivorans]|jgi:exodeoxyribonuclease VII small subunit|uniref:Exodeoxyribonuclease 7 small subunit n=1 Tax=Granulicella pectinivorans TaxID=474950 RepID=A0A1I6M8B7_9BACT|nr:exodeoxyribonuclease VII small subunit [Granulicella pectinivorans]SFS11921.1 Exodeoxyribonuclease VII small subunit [Granulicella pectinivorans]
MASFEEKLASLESVVERLERGELSLDESVRLFEEGVGLSNACKAELEAAEARIEVLVEPESGGFRTAVLDDPEGEDAEEDTEELVDEDEL